MKNYLTFTLFLCTILSANAQLATYDISTYARPDLERRTLSIIPRFTSNGTSRAIPIGGINGANETNTYNGFQIGASNAIIHTKFVNTPTTQLSVRNEIGFLVDYDTQKASSLDLDVHSNNFKFDVSYSRNYSRKKFNEAQKFWEVDYNLGLRYIFIQQNDELSQQKISDQDVPSNFGLGIYRGKGRIELVNDAWHAQTILEILQANNSLESDPTHEAITQLAYRISEIKNFRNTDFRLEGVAEYEALVQYFMENNLVQKDDYRFFALLNDAWRYESFITRRSGTEFKYGIKANARLIDFIEFNFPQIDDDILSYDFPVLSIQLNRFKPISTDFQFNIENEITFGLNGIENLDNETLNFDNNTFIARLSTSWAYQYLPNQRTYYALAVRLNSTYANEFQQLYLNDSFRINLSSGLNYRYYVSPQLAISLSADVFFDYTKFLDSELSARAFDYRLVFQTSYRLY